VKWVIWLVRNKRKGSIRDNVFYRSKSWLRRFKGNLVFGKKAASFVEVFEAIGREQSQNFRTTVPSCGGKPKHRCTERILPSWLIRLNLATRGKVNPEEGELIFCKAERGPRWKNNVNWGERHPDSNWRHWPCPIAKNTRHGGKRKSWKSESQSSSFLLLEHKRRSKKSE